MPIGLRPGAILSEFPLRTHPAPENFPVCNEDVIEELPTPIRAALVQAEKPEAEQRNRLAADGLNGSEKKAL